MEKDPEETVYLTDNDAHVMSERVRTLASSVYKEFEKMITKYDEDVVQSLMPLVVGILESLDNAYTDKQEQEVDLELYKEDNEQLLTQYEREKQLRKTVEQKQLELEDNFEDERKEMNDKVETLESNVRMLELKAKNVQDHVMRLEDKESELKKEYSKLHDRYTELFKTHMEYMEKTKFLMTGDRIVDSSVTVKKSQMTLPQLRPVNAQLGLYSTELPAGSDVGKTPDGYPGSITPLERTKPIASLQNEMQNVEKSETEETEKDPIPNDSKQPIDCESDEKDRLSTNDADLTLRNDTTEIIKAFELPKSKDEMHVLVSSDVLLSGDDLPSPENFEIQTGKSKLQTSNVSYEEVVHASPRIDDENFDIAGMGKEVENLILENTELLTTKNALNVVKDDLIAKVDELTSEQEILREEINSLQNVKERLNKRITELEGEVKKSREEIEKLKASSAEDKEEELPTGQRKRFTRVEMARVLTERNQYKERLMELQEAVRWTEMLRASKEHPELAGNKQSQEKRSGLWHIFSSMFSSKAQNKKAILPSASIRFSAPSSSVKPVGDPNKEERELMEESLGNKAKAFDFLQEEDLAKKQREHSKRLRSYVKKDDGRIQAYGWSLSSKIAAKDLKNNGGQSNSQASVPYPIHYGSLIDDDSIMKVACAAPVKLGGGKTRDGGCIVGASIFYSGEKKDDNVEEAKTDDKKILMKRVKIKTTKN